MKAVVVWLALLLTGGTTALGGWKNPRQSPSVTQPIFGTHDYIAFKGYELAGRPTWIKNNLNAYFIGTEAPDNGFKLPAAVGNYNDASRCHCVLFDVNGNVTNDRDELRTREEFDKAQAAFGSGDRRLAAFYAGAIAHYVGDLGQFHHIMGSESHWGSEDPSHHSAYEVAVEATIDFQTRSSSLLDSRISAVGVTGQTPETIARAAARFTEKGNSGRTTGSMYKRWKTLRGQGKSSVAEWDEPFRTQTGQNVNFAANAIAKLLKKVSQ